MCVYIYIYIFTHTHTYQFVTLVPARACPLRCRSLPASLRAAQAGIPFTWEPIVVIITIVIIIILVIVCSNMYNYTAMSISMSSVISIPSLTL